MEINEVSGIIVDVAIKIHQEMGPGLFESVYEEIMCFEISERGLFYERQKEIPVIYKERKMEIGFRADLIVEQKVIVEIKSIEVLSPVHHKQLLSYLRLTGLTVGLLINFNEALLKDGIKRIVNNF